MKIDDALKKRLITGAIGAVLLLLIIIVGGTIGVTLLSAALVVLCALEYFNMFFPAPHQQILKWTGLGLAFVLFTLFAVDLPGLYFMVIFVIILMALFTLALILARELTNKDLPDLVSSMGYILLGAIYLSLAFAFLPKLREQTNIGSALTIIAFLVPWTGDTGAFFAGKKWGKRPLFSLISPNKTVEGLLGGMGATILILLISKLIFFHNISYVNCFMLGILGTAMSHLGDLFESLLKRSRGVKDSGFLIPGHGGFMDRFDGFMFTTPFIYIYSMLFI